MANGGITRASKAAIAIKRRVDSVDERRRVRDQRSRPIVDDPHKYLEARGRQVSAKSLLGGAICYMLPRPGRLFRFLDDGALALNCKNALFAESDEGGDNWAVIATLIENCKLTGINRHT